MIGMFLAAHAAALKKLIDGMPVAELSAALAGRAGLDGDLELAEQLAGLIGAAFPPAALTATEVTLALEALRLLLASARALPAPIHVAGGYPDIVAQENAPNFRDR